MSILQKIDKAALWQLFKLAVVGPFSTIPYLTASRTWSGLTFNAFAAYTPTVTAGSGTFTTVSATGRWCQIGKLVFFQAEVTITTNGSAATSVNFTLPTTANADAMFVGRETNVTQNALTSVVAAGSNIAMTVSYSGTYPGANGYKDIVSGCYESQ